MLRGPDPPTPSGCALGSVGCTMRDEYNVFYKDFYRDL